MERNSLFICFLVLNLCLLGSGENDIMVPPDGPNAKQEWNDVCSMKNTVGAKRILSCGQHTKEPTCLLPESVCDGILDCNDGWDESPHLCVGHCDNENYYQYPTYTYKIHDNLVKSLDLKTAFACHKECVTNTNCTHFHYRGKKGHDSCYLLSGNSNSKDEADTAFKHAGVTRGPATCDGREDWKDKNQCRPIQGVPYRSGVYLVQSTNGFWWTADSKTAAAGDKRGDFSLSKRSYKDVVTRQEADGESNNPSEFLFEFHPAKHLHYSYFLIQPRYGKIKDFKDIDMYVTQHDKASTLEFRKKGKHPDSDEGQRWYIEPHRKEHGLINVKLYTLVEGKKWYALANENYSVEYNIGGDSSYTEPGLKMTSDWHWTPLSEILKTFRLWECDYGLENGQAFQGLKRKSYPKYEVSNMLEDLLPMSVQQKNRLLNMAWGIPYHRLEAARLDGHWFDFVKHVEEEFAASSSAWDYAGRMRLYDMDLQRMKEYWEKISKTDKPRDRVDGKLIYEMIQDYLTKGFFEV